MCLKSKSKQQKHLIFTPKVMHYINGIDVHVTFVAILYMKTYVPITYIQVGT